jgi:hypothetical protein
LIAVLVARVFMIGHDPAVHVVHRLAHGVLAEHREATFLQASHRVAVGPQADRLFEHLVHGHDGTSTQLLVVRSVRRRRSGGQRNAPSRTRPTADIVPRMTRPTRRSAR